jgi:hypothetical protein
MCSLAAYRTFLVAISQIIGHAEYGGCCVCEFYQERAVVREQLLLHSIIAVLIVAATASGIRDGAETGLLTHYLGLFVLIVDQCIIFQFPNCSDAYFRVD